MSDRPINEPLPEQDDVVVPDAEQAPDGPVAAEDRPHAGLTSRGRVRRTRASLAWVGVIAAAILGIFLLIFIAQNLDKVTIHFLGYDGKISLAIALLLATIIGALLVALPGSARILQLRRALRKNAKS